MDNESQKVIKEIIFVINASVSNVPNPIAQGALAIALVKNVCLFGDDAEHEQAIEAWLDGIRQSWRGYKDLEL